MTDLHTRAVTLADADGTAPDVAEVIHDLLDALKAVPLSAAVAYEAAALAAHDQLFPRNEPENWTGWDRIRAGDAGIACNTLRALPMPTDDELDAAALARPVVVALVEAADRMLAVIVDAMEYRHSGDPWEENAMSMREMDIHYYYDSPQLELDRATLSAAKGATH